MICLLLRVGYWIPVLLLYCCLFFPLDLVFPYISVLWYWVHINLQIVMSSCGVGNGNPLSNSCLENPMGRGACGLQTVALQRVGHDWSDSARIHAYFLDVLAPLSLSNNPVSCCHFWLEVCLSDISMSNSTFFWFPLVWSNTFHSFTLMLCVSLELKWVSCRQHIVECFPFKNLSRHSVPFYWWTHSVCI